LHNTASTIKEQLKEAFQRYDKIQAHFEKKISPLTKSG